MLAYERRSNEHTKLIAELTQKVREKRNCEVTEQLYPYLLARKTYCFKFVLPSKYHYRVHVSDIFVLNLTVCRLLVVPLSLSPSCLTGKKMTPATTLFPGPFP